jgi:predicted metalloprotease with PDZ domain
MIQPRLRTQIRRWFLYVVIAQSLQILPAFSQTPKKTQPPAISSSVEMQQPLPTMFYTLNLNDRADDQFKVKLSVSGLKPEHSVYQFASTAPGAYQVMNMGRYVRRFKAFDKAGKEVKTERVSVNQWKFADPTSVVEIQYAIAETWDSVVKENPIYEMCGSSLEQDHALVNGQTAFGYITGLQHAPVMLRIERPASWNVGTALDTNEQGMFVAKNYDHLVDSPILLGRLTRSATTVKGAEIEIYTYSKTGKIRSEQLLDAMQSMLRAAGEFMRELPVQRYVFLYHFENQSVGAWEHSYSSEYVLEEKDYTPEYGQTITDIAAHEFFHVMTPLSIHSELIEQFNFVTPTASEHLWLYEGTTEWAAHIMQLRAGLITPEQWFKTTSQKIFYDRVLYDRNYSLSKLSLTSFTPAGQKQYGNIYMRGALVSTLLDIRLLELSGGKRGLRELVLELAKKYGPSKPFSEKDFFKELVAMTYPEIEQFIEDYIKHAQPLPIKEYFEKLGITYFDAKPLGNDVVELSVRTTLQNGKFIVTDYRSALDTCGIREGDEVISLNDKPIEAKSVNALNAQFAKLPVGSTYTLGVRRDGKDLTLRLPVVAKKAEQPYLFEFNPNAYKKQIALREAWMKNLK